MKRSNKELDGIIDATAAQIHGEYIASSLVDDASQRVWAQLGNATSNNNSMEFAASATQSQIANHRSIEGCADYQSLIPALLNNELTTARKLLLEDHTNECVPCRRALKQARTSGVVASSHTSGTLRQRQIPRTTPGFNFGNVFSTGMTQQWRVAAALLVTFGLIGLFVFRPFGGETFGGTVQAAEGAVYRVADEDSRAIASGEAVKANESIRTARGAHASFKLADGSLVEMRERSQFSLAEHRRGATLNVERGDFIVQMPDKDSKNLYVAINDALVSANGATLAVTSGTKGTRVSVIKGTATVDHEAVTKIVKAGEQFTTRANLEATTLADNVRWSRDAARYDKLIGELHGVRADINNRVARPGVRHSTRLLDLAPADTMLYVALPNWSGTLTDARAILQEHINENPALGKWWRERHANGQKGGDIDGVLGHVREWGGQLKDEIVVSVARDAASATGNSRERVLLLSEVKDPIGFRSFVTGKLVALGAEKSAPVRIIDDPNAAQASDNADAGKDARAPEIFVWIHNDIVAVSTQLTTLRDLSSRMGATQPAASASLHSRLADLYREGTSLIIAADLERVIADELASDTTRATDAKGRLAFEQSGMADVRHLIIESKDASDRTMNRAVLSFKGERRGMAAWLAAPAAMGSLEFISPEASMAAAFVVKEPTAVVGDIFNFLKTVDPSLMQTFAETQTANGVDITRDLAAPLGGEFAFAIDGPLLPVPSWKLIFEVDDPARLNTTFERLVERVNVVAKRENKRGFTTEKEEASGQTFYTIKSLDLGLSVHYIYANNYLVMTPSRALLDRTLRYREAQTTLLRAPRFVQSLPTDGDANFSALFYQNLGEVLSPLASTMRGIGASAAKKSSEANEALNALDTLSPPALAYARANGDSIVFAAPTKGGPFGVSPSTLLGLPGGIGLQNVLEQATGEGTSSEGTSR